MPILKQKVKTTNDQISGNGGGNTVKKILILSANPKTTPKLQLDEEIRGIEEGLRRSKFRDRFAIHAVWAVRHRDIRQALLDYHPDFVHFTGHGEENGIMVEDELGMASRFPAKAFSELLKLCSDHVECVILNACHTVHLAAMVNKHIDYVIGMKKEVSDKAAIEFSIGFYDAIGTGSTIDKAFEFGRTAILARCTDFPDYLRPVLKKKKGLVNFKLCLETVSETYHGRVESDIATLELKNRLIEELKLPRFFEDGRGISYYLMSKTREVILNENLILKENDIKENEEFTFLIEMDNE